MPTESRRIFLYWLLLLVPTLAVGTGAIILLRSQQTRLAERTAIADEARRAAVSARAGLIVENVELLVGDVEAGLLDALAATPEAGLDRFLDRWEKNNPLVRTAFLASTDGRILRPGPDVVGENANGFVRRFSKLFAEQPPWGAGPAPQLQAPSAKEKKNSLDSNYRDQAESNIAQTQSARREVQELLKVHEYPSAASSGLSVEADGVGTSGAKVQPSVGLSLADSGSRQDAAKGMDAIDESRASMADSKRLAAADAPMARSKDASSDSRGWVPRMVDGRMHLLGWVRSEQDAVVRGVELEMAALINRLGGALPAETATGEAYALRDDQGRILHQSGAVSRLGEPVVRVPLSESVLPGWEAVAYLALAPASGPGATAFFLTGSLLIATFVVAILAAGSLLLRQARLSGVDAAQKSSFVANVSHEFKTPLTTIRLYSELLEQGRVRDAAQGAEYLRTIGRESQRLARLVNNVLDFSRLEQGGKKFALEAADLGGELKRVLVSLSPRLEEAGLRLATDIPEVPLQVRTDRDAFEQIVLNLVDNACKYAAGGGEVAVSLAPRGSGGAELRVLDRGPGVPEGHRGLIFGKFHQVDETLTAGKSGVGLGLSIARQLARGLGGDLRVEPRDGGGAVFILELP